MRHAADRLRCFNPLPSPKQGETPAHARKPPSSPHRSKGRRQLFDECFNPLPSPKQGETTPCGMPPTVCMFQSAPLTEARGDKPANQQDERPIERSFNPLPSPKQGETTANSVSRASSPVSIRSPHRSKGRPSPNPLDKLVGCVSIRSPHRSKGRPSPINGVRRCCGVAMFQSAPLTEARGDAWQLFQSAGKQVAPLFQSAPLTEARGDAGRYNQRNNKDLHRQMRDSFR